MYNLDPNAHARAVIEYRIHDANNRRLAREARRSAEPAVPALPVREPRRHSHLWSLVHFRQAHRAYGLPS
jgi:hypothetical protein